MFLPFDRNWWLKWTNNNYCTQIFTFQNCFDAHKHLKYVSMSRVNGRPVRKVYPIALIVMHETEHVLMNTWKLPLVCVQLSPAPSPWKKKQSAFVNARVVAHRLKIKYFIFIRVDHHYFLAMGKWSNSACDWQVELNWPIRNTVCGQRSFPKEKQPWASKIYMVHLRPLPSFWRSYTPLVQTSFFPPAFCCCRNKKHRNFYLVP